MRFSFLISTLQGSTLLGSAVGLSALVLFALFFASASNVIFLLTFLGGVSEASLTLVSLSDVFLALLLPLPPAFGVYFLSRFSSRPSCLTPSSPYRLTRFPRLTERSA